LSPTKSGILRSGNEDFKAHAVLKQPTYIYIIYICIHKQSKMERAEEADDQQFPATSVATKPNPDG
jgi:hypothetical protein